jgi:ATP-dependent RNA helicase RhlE
VFGGVSLRPQIATLRKGVDILVATPGRLLDLVRQHALRLNHVETLVLDEADQMLDMGFIDDLRRIVSYVPMPRQTVMLSATMPAPIRELATAWLQQPKYVAVPRETATPTRIDQAVCFVPQQQKRQVLAHYLRGQGSSRTLIFCRTKHGADKVVKYLDQVGLPAIAIHGNKSQNARQNALSAFKAGTHSILVATDIASRGLQIDAIETVLNFELPETPEVYVHRIGRTARANSSGQALTLCAPEERIKLRQIERLTRVPLREWKTEIHAAQHSSHILPKTSTCVDRRAALGGEASAGHRQPGRPIRHRTSS